MFHRPASVGGLATVVVLALLTATGLLQRTATGDPLPAPSDTVARTNVSVSHTQSDCRRTTSGTGVVDIAFQGRFYPVRIHVPTTADPTAPLPLVLDLHGSESNGVSQARLSDLDAVADADATGFIVAEPTAAIEEPSDDPPPEGGWTWNVPGVPNATEEYSPADARSDVDYLSTVVQEIGAQDCVDPQRVYATGFSDGASMASALACARPDLVAAVAPVSGLRAGRPTDEDPTVLDPDSCLPDQGVSVITFHGREDYVNAYDGDDSYRWGYDVDSALRHWVEIDRCDPEASVESVGDTVELTSFDGCAQGTAVEAYTFLDGGHSWPGSPIRTTVAGVSSQDLSAEQVMWNFFAAHPKESSPTVTG